MVLWDELRVDHAVSKVAGFQKVSEGCMYKLDDLTSERIAGPGRISALLGDPKSMEKDWSKPQ